MKVCLQLCLVLWFLGRAVAWSTGEGDDPPKKSSPKKKPKKVVVNTLPDPSDIPPKLCTEEQWAAIAYEDVCLACDNVGLLRTGPVEVMAARLATYYREVSAEQQLLEQIVSSCDSQVQRHHPYLPPHTSWTSSSSFQEHELLLAQHRSAIDRVENYQHQQSWGHATSMLSSMPSSSSGCTWSTAYSSLPSSSFAAPVPPQLSGPGPLPPSGSGANSGFSGDVSSIL